mgnify:CR=1 FL=1
MHFRKIFQRQKNVSFSRNDLQIYLEKNGIQTRPIFSGNILKQPLMKNRYYKKKWCRSYIFKRTTNRKKFC